MKTFEDFNIDPGRASWCGGANHLPAVQPYPKEIQGSLPECEHG
jgi:hypothetical protein